MLCQFKPYAFVAATLGALSAGWTTPAHADCTIEGIAYRVMAGDGGDPTGPTIYLKEDPQDSFYYFVRLRDGRFVSGILDQLGEVRVRIRGDARSCPSEGIVRDAGTIVGEISVIGPVAHVQARD